MNLSAEGQELKGKLETIRAKKRLLKSIERQMAEARAEIGITIQDYSKTPVQGGIKTPAQERFALLIDRLTDKYDKVMEEAFTLEDELANSLGTLNETEQSMLIDRYVNGWSWDKIARVYGYCDRQCRRIKNNGIEKLAKKITSRP